MPKRLIIALFAVFVLLLIFAPIASYCLGRDQDYRNTSGMQAAPAPVGSMSADTPAALSPAIGPFLAYVKSGPQLAVDHRGVAVPRDQAVVVYDLGADRVLWMRGASQQALIAKLAGSRVVLADEKHVSLVSADGGSVDLLYEEKDPATRVLDVAAAKHGRTVGVTLRRQPGCAAAASGPTYCPGYGSILFIDVASRAVIQRVDTDDSARWQRYRAFPHWPVWRDDGLGMVVAGETGSERPGGLVTVFGDGRAVVHNVRGYSDVAPNGRIVVHDFGSMGCLSVSSQRIAVLDLDSEKDIAVFEDQTLVLSPGEWSPDSSEYLIAYGSTTKPALRARTAATGAQRRNGCCLTSRRGGWNRWRTAMLCSGAGTASAWWKCATAARPGMARRRRGCGRTTASSASMTG